MEAMALGELNVATSLPSKTRMRLHIHDEYDPLTSKYRNKALNYICDHC